MLSRSFDTATIVGYHTLIMGPSMCKFPYSILIVYYSNLILLSVILLYIIEYYKYITNDVMSRIYT